MARKKREKPPATTDSRAGVDGAPPPENWADQKDSAAYIAAAKLYTPIQRCYENKQQVGMQLEEFWKIYNAQPDENQQYMGNSQGYIPAVRDSINARAKRALKQLFPNKYRHVEAMGTQDAPPQAQMSLMEHYIRATGLKDVVRSMLVAGDVTGQWCCYADWMRCQRTITKLVKRNPIIEGAVPDPMGGRSAEPLVDPLEEEEVKEIEEIHEEGPDIVDIAVEDVAVLPPTCNDIEKSEASAVRLRLTRESVQRFVDEGVFMLPGGADKKSQDIAKWLTSGESPQDGGMRGKPPPRQRTEEAGIQTEGTQKYLLVYEVHTMLDLGGEHPELAFVYYAAPSLIIGIIRSPFWGGKRPLISVPANRISGSHFGISNIEPVKFLQWNLNDFWNMGQDSAMYSLLPIVMTDPLKNPMYQSMVMGLAAVWPTSPNDTKALEFPQLWKEAAQYCGALKAQIRESLDVNEMMVGEMPSGRKNNALVGAMQQEASVGVSDHAERFEDKVLNPILERIFEYDSQFRTKSLTIKTQGEVGAQAIIEQVEPQQWGQKYQFEWTGTSIVTGNQMLQMQIALMNVLRGIPPQQLNGYTLDVTPILVRLAERAFGTELAPKILIDKRNAFTIPAGVENEILVNGMDVATHEADDDVEHIQSHQQAGAATGDLAGKFRTHINEHMAQLMAKRQQAMAAQAGMQPGGGQRPQGVIGAPGPSAGVNPGNAGTPRPGAMPAPSRPMQNPPGAIQQDNMLGAPGRG